MNEKDKIIDTLKFAMKATDCEDNYSVGMYNGIAYALSVVTGVEPNFKNCEVRADEAGNKQYGQ